ncbi:MAG: Crp/Fnr family transcriptional regulator [Clostridium sp.]|nr:Crp/Fnr family transcriptional regulator [Clostridium sp.]
MEKKIISKKGENREPLAAGLEHNLLFHEIEKEDIELILKCSQARRVCYEKGRVIYQKGDEQRYLYVLIKGCVNIVQNTSAGRKNILYRIESGSVFGENYMAYDQQKFQYDAEACTAVEMLVIPWAFFHCFCDETCRYHKKLVGNLMNILLKKESQSMEKLSIVATTSLKERMARWLLLEAGNREFIHMGVSRQFLADFLGAARPSVSRTLSWMQEQGLIEIKKKKIFLIDRDGIESLL